MRPTAVSTAWKAIPAASPFVKEVPVRLERDRDRAGGDADVPRRERDEAGDVEGGDDHDRGRERLVDAERGADGGRGDEAADVETASQATRRAAPVRLAAERAEGVEEVAALLAAARRSRRRRRAATSPTAMRSGQSGTAPATAAGDDERAEHDGAGGAERGEGAAGRPEALSAREDAGEEPDPDGVAGAEGHEGVDERAGAVARAGVGDGEAAAAEPDRAAPGAGGGDDGDREADPGEPEPFRVGGGDGVECRRDARAEELGRRDGREEGEQQEGSSGDAAATDPGADLGER